jgi:hypothetical protein
MNIKNNPTRLSINVNPNQNFLYIILFQDLGQEWSNVDKKKQKFYYRLYWKLLIIQYKNNYKSKLKWTLENKKDFSKFHEKLNNHKQDLPLNILNTSIFYKNAIINRFQSIDLKGYTVHGEEVLNFKNKYEKN